MYEHLLAPLKLPHITLRNRTLMGSMHTGLEDRAKDYPKLAAYLAARAEAEAGLIVTGGIAPNLRASLAPFASNLIGRWQVKRHQTVTRAVKDAGGAICMQILHAGRYGYHPFCVAPSAIQAPISPFKPKALSTKGVQKHIRSYVRCAQLARDAGYDGVEIMGSEGYFLHQFLCTRTNTREDAYGGTFENRARIAREVVQHTRQALGDDFLIVFRLSMLDLVEKGSSWDEIVQLAKWLEQDGVTLLNTGIGWHEARIPTIATMVPRAGFSWVTEKLKPEISIPVITTNRINTPEVAEQVLAQGHADMVSMARPFLADAEFVRKARAHRADEINTCIACNQACLDHTFKKQRASCLVNPFACYETELISRPAQDIKKVAVVGAGPAGMACALEAAKRGHQVTLFERSDALGGQFNMAKRIPGKEEFHETLRYFDRQLDKANVRRQFNTTADANTLQDFDIAVIATGVTPRNPQIPGIDHAKTLSYIDVLRGNAAVGDKVAIIGAGGIGFDVAEFLLHKTHQPPSVAEFTRTWGVDTQFDDRGGLEPAKPRPADREIHLLQRKTTKLGKGLGKTTGWIHRLSLRHAGVHMHPGARYEKIDDQGLHVYFPETEERRVLDVDHVVICAGQIPQRSLYDAIKDLDNLETHLIGGADVAAELDAKRAIRQGTKLALSL